MKNFASTTPFPNPLRSSIAGWGGGSGDNSNNIKPAAINVDADLNKKEMFEKNNNTDEFSCIDSTVAEVNPLTHPHQPIKVYDNAKTFKEEILKDFKGKTIIYL
jgi:hypothetical protein